LLFCFFAALSSRLQLPYVTETSEIPHRSSGGQVEPFYIAESSSHPKGLSGFLDMPCASIFVPQVSQEEAPARASLFIMPDSEDCIMPPLRHEIVFPVRPRHVQVIPTFSQRSFLVLLWDNTGDARMGGLLPSSPSPPAKKVGLFEVVVDQKRGVLLNDLSEEQRGQIPDSTSLGTFGHPTLNPNQMPLVATSGRHALLVTSRNALYSLSLSSLEWTLHCGGLPVSSQQIARVVPMGINQIALFKISSPAQKLDLLVAHLFPQPHNRPVEVRLEDIALQNCFELGDSFFLSSFSSLSMVAANGMVVVLKGTDESGLQMQRGHASVGSPMAGLPVMHVAVGLAPPPAEFVVLHQCQWQSLQPETVGLERLLRKRGTFQLVHSPHSDKIWVFCRCREQNTVQMMCMHRASALAAAFEHHPFSSAGTSSANISKDAAALRKKHCLNCHILDPKMKCSRCRSAS
jgi:hypothetical protein